MFKVRLRCETGALKKDEYQCQLHSLKKKITLWDTTAPTVLCKGQGTRTELDTFLYGHNLVDKLTKMDVIGRGWL